MSSTQKLPNNRAQVTCWICGDTVPLAKITGPQDSCNQCHKHYLEYNKPEIAHSMTSELLTSSTPTNLCSIKRTQRQIDKQLENEIFRTTKETILEVLHDE